MNPKHKVSANKMHIYKQYLATIASSFLSISGGLMFGISTVMLPQLRQDESFPYDQYYDSWIASIATLSMIVSCPLAGTILDRFGRRLSHIMFSIPFVIGWFCITIASNNALILIGRFMTGIANGATRPITLVYIGEIADPKYRSIFLFVSGLFIHIGVLLSHIIGEYCYWKTSCALCLIPAVVPIIAFIYLKDSPLWLIAKGRIDEGIETFTWFRGEGEDAKVELDAIIEGQKDISAKMTLSELKNFVFTRNFMKVTIALFFLSLVLPSCGLTVIFFYAVDIFNITFSGKIDAFILVIAIDFVKIFESTLLCMFANFLTKKKVTFMACCFGVTLSLVFLCVCLYINSDKLLCTLVILMIFYAIFESAILTIGWTFIPEILPNNVRGLASALTSSASFAFMFVAVKIVPNIIHMYGVLTMYLIFAIVTLISTIALCVSLPETSGKTLQDIENSVTKNSKIVAKL